MGSTENEGTKEASGASTKVGYVALVEYVVSMRGALEEMEYPGQRQRDALDKFGLG